MIDIKEFYIPRHILEILLKDRTTGRNILWGTDQYGFDPKSHIEIDQIISGDVIKPRVLKSLEDQKLRTDSKAEVYTPIEIIKKMNDAVDTEEPINEIYIKRKVLEVTCGEAPYLVSRYDVSTGKMIPLEERQLEKGEKAVFSLHGKVMISIIRSLLEKKITSISVKDNFGISYSVSQEQIYEVTNYFNMFCSDLSELSNRFDAYDH